MKRSVWIGAAILVLVAGLGVGSVVLERKAAVQAAGVQAPMFEVDPMWPKPMPHHWVIGMTIGRLGLAAGGHRADRGDTAGQGGGAAGAELPARS